MANRRHQPSGHRQQHGQKHGGQAELECRWCALGDELSYGYARKERHAKIGVDRVVQPDHVLHGQRLIEAIGIADGRQRFGRGVLPGQDHRRITRDQPHAEKDDDRREQDDRDGFGQAPDQERRHAARAMTPGMRRWASGTQSCCTSVPGPWHLPLRVGPCSTTGTPTTDPG